MGPLLYPTVLTPLSKPLRYPHSNQVLILCYTHEVKLESKFVAVVVAIGVLEGLGRRLDPEIDIIVRAAPYVLRAAFNMSSAPR